jgi:hypothetical protein
VIGGMAFLIHASNIRAGDARVHLVEILIRSGHSDSNGIPHLVFF